MPTDRSVKPTLTAIPLSAPTLANETLVQIPKSQIYVHTVPTVHTYTYPHCRSRDHHVPCIQQGFDLDRPGTTARRWSGRRSLRCQPARWQHANCHQSGPPVQDSTAGRSLTYLLTHPGTQAPLRNTLVPSHVCKVMQYMRLA